MIKIKQIKHRGWEYNSLDDTWTHPKKVTEPLSLWEVLQLEKESLILKRRLKVMEYRYNLNWLLDSGWRIVKPKIPAMFYLPEHDITLTKNQVFCGVVTAIILQIKDEERNKE